MKNKSFVLIIALLASLLAGCNTIHGAGKDIERGGEKIQKKSQ